MSLTPEDRKWIRNEMAASEERVYTRIKKNALGEVTGRLDGIDKRLDGMDETISSMAEDVAKMPVIEAEIRLVNQNVEAIRDYHGI